MTTSEALSEATLRDYIARFSNWGRWGEDDEIGALNLITPACIARAARLVTQGRSISLTLPYDAFGPQNGGFRPNPQLLTTATGTDHLGGAQDPLPGGWGPAKGFGYADDTVILPTQAGTQWDALSHIFYEGRMWNGRSAAEVTSKGAAHNGIEKLTGRIVTRGVFLDLATWKGVETLEPGYAITPDEVDTYCADKGIAVESGDALIVRTGFMSARRAAWGDYSGGAAPGLSLTMAPWLYDHEIAAVATDTWGVEVRPNEIPVFQPLHLVSLVHGGIPFGEIFDLDALAVDCREDGVYVFMFVASPLPITGAAGSPVSALALK
ncbi:cyclase family protein [Nocardioides sp.]|uniref:cyclase family protein n=1 Tax=Nocardioides sp. TaxID=35761 RepID=UPI0039E5450C